MAEVTAMRNNVLPYPLYGLPYVVSFPMLDADGDLVTGATTPDAEISKNGDTFADCTNESTEIATSSGTYYLSLTGTELTCDLATIIAKSATAGMKTTVLTLYPRKIVAIRSGTAQTGAAGSVTLDANASAIDDYYNGCIIAGTLDSNVEVRTITDYNGSTKVATVTPDWVTTPDSDDTFVIYLPPEMRQIAQSDVLAWNGAAVASPHTAGYPVVTIKDGTGTGELDTASGVVLAKDHTGANLATASALDTVDNFLDTEIASIISTIGTPAGASVSADIAAVKAQTAAIETDTAEIGAAGAGLTALASQASVNIIDDFLDTEIAAILAAVDTEVAAILEDTGTTIPAQISALNNLSAAQVNAEVVDALNVDTYAEIGQETPAATQTIRKMVAYLYKAWRNKTEQTAAQYSLYNDDGTTLAQKATVSDDGTTFTRGEVATGP